MKRPVLTLALLFMSLLGFSQQGTGDLTIEEFAIKLKMTRDPQLLDVRTAEEYSENHLPGAQSLPIKDSVSFWDGISRLDKSQPVFVYSINNGRSNMVSKKLIERGFTEVYKLPGGIAHWLGKAYPVVSTRSVQTTYSELQNVVASNDVTLVSIGSKYCGSCRKLAPIVSEIEATNDALKIVKAELYNDSEIASKLNIQAVPTLVLYRDGREVWRNAGFISKDDLQKVIARQTGGL